MKLTRTPKSSRTPMVVVGASPRVNLLPPAISAKRDQTKLLTQWGMRIVAVAILVAVGCVGLFGWQTVTDIRLAATKSESDSLYARLAAEKETSQIVQKEKDLDLFRLEAMTTDVVWAALIESLRAELPEGAILRSYNLQTGAAPSADDDAEPGMTGQITIGGTFSSPATLLTSVSRVPGLTDVRLVDGAVDQTSGQFLQNLEVNFDQTIYVGSQEEKGSEETTDKTAPDSAEVSADAEATEATE